MSDEACIYHIDDADNIIWVNEEYEKFSAENDAPDLTARSTIGESIWKFITDVETLHLYQIMVKEVRESDQEISFTLHCDGPDCTRKLEMHIRPLKNNHIEFYSELKEKQDRTPQNLLSMNADRSDEMLVLCGWCNKVKLPDERWVDVEVATDELELFRKSRLPALSHGMCDSCQDIYFGELNKFVEKQSA